MNPSIHDVSKSAAGGQDRTWAGAVTRCFPRSLRRSGGARRDRTDDLMLAKHALYQLSYGP
jgi:hypothetical protein